MPSHNHSKNVFIFVLSKMQVTCEYIGVLIWSQNIWCPLLTFKWLILYILKIASVNNQSIWTWQTHSMLAVNALTQCCKSSLFVGCVRELYIQSVSMTQSESITGQPESRNHFLSIKAYFLWCIWHLHPFLQ